MGPSSAVSPIARVFNQCNLMKSEHSSEGLAAPADWLVAALRAVEGGGGAGLVTPELPLTTEPGRQMVDCNNHLFMAVMSVMS